MSRRSLRRRGGLAVLQIHHEDALPSLGRGKGGGGKRAALEVARKPGEHPSRVGAGKVPDDRARHDGRL
jgi:hypothetical protein